MKKYLIIALSLLIYTCSDDDPAAPVSGCMTDTACNYNVAAVTDDGSCWEAAAGCSCSDAEDATIDTCGVCDGDDLPNTGTCDCAGTPAGTAVVDCAGVCGGDAVVGGCDNVCGSTLVDDCAGTCGGSAVLSGCDMLCGSTAVEDACGVCGGDGSSCASSFDGADGCTLPENTVYVVANGDVLYNIPEDISGLQWTVDGTAVSGGSGGTAGAAGYTISAGGSTFLAFSFSGAVISDDCGVLVNMTLTDYSALTGLSDLVIANTVGGSTSVTYYTE